MKSVVLLFSTFFAFAAFAQNADSIPKKGSYLYYGQPSIEDNSMFIEEAFNQETGIIQHISNLVITGRELTYSYTQEIPLKSDRHQLSFGVSYSKLSMPEGVSDLARSQFKTKGVGDIMINYRPMLFDKNDWALVIPRFSLIVPTGDASYGFGSGAWGGQFNLAVTKRLNSKITTHYNAGYSIFSNSDYYSYTSEGLPFKKFEKNLGVSNLGGSAIWLVAPKVNLMVEYMSSFGKEIQDDGQLVSSRSAVINPGFRFAIDINNIQIVPGFGVPLNYYNGKFENSSAFIYLSIEPAY